MPSQYNPGIPTGLVNLDQDYKNIQNNFTQLNTTFGTDHTTVDDATANNGYHTTIRLIPQSTPGSLSGIGRLYAKTQNDGYASDQSLYYKTGDGSRNIQITSNFTPVGAANGYTFLPGGIVMQWGVYTRGGSWPSGEQTVTFATSNKTFSSACYTVTVTFKGPASSSSGDITVTSISASNFKWEFTGQSTAAYTGFYWVALGK